MATSADAIYAWGAALPRTDAVVVRGRRKLRVGSMVYLAVSADEALMGFGYPKLEREAREFVIDARDMVVPRFLARQTRLALDMVRRDA